MHANLALNQIQIVLAVILHILDPWNRINVIVILVIMMMDRLVFVNNVTMHA